MSNSLQQPYLYSGFIPKRNLQSCHTDQNFPFIPKSQKFLSQSQSRYNLLITSHHIMMSKPRCNIIIACVAGACVFDTMYFSYHLRPGAEPGFFQRGGCIMRVKFSPSGIPHLSALRQQFPESHFIITLNPASDP